MSQLNEQKLLERIDNLIAKFRDEDRQLFLSWKEQVVDKLLFKDLQEHEGIKKFCKTLADEIEADYKKLSVKTSEFLPDKQRDALILHKDLCLLFLGLFRNLDEELSRIEKQVKEQEDFYAETYGLQN